MKHQDETTSVCEGCGASVYRQHLDSGIARYEGGKLLCSHCVADYEKEHDAAGGAPEEAFEPIEFDDEPEAPRAASAEPAKSKIHGASTGVFGAQHGAWDDARFQRPLRPDSVGATRVRTFHCKLSEGAIDFMINQINDWLDHNDQIVVKFTNTTIGPFEGKHTEPNLIITVFY